MKKIIIAFAALAAAFSIASCNKEEVEAPSAELKLNITVGNLDGSPTTKAVKTSWETGDKINLWFDETNIASPDLILTYNGTGWTAGELKKTPQASGNLIILYEGYNDWNKYRHTSEYMYSSVDKFAGAVNGYAWAQPLAYTNSIEIPYTYESNTLSANLSKWQCLTQIQVVVAGLDSEKATDYALKEQNMARGIVYHSAKSITTSMTTMSGPTLGVPNKDGVAFCFMRSANGVTDRTFTLLDLNTMTEYTYKVSGKTLELGLSTVAAIKIDASKFFGSSKTKGTAKRTGDIDVNWVQLWENGPKFAEYNVGVTDGKAESCGGYYCWGKTTDKDASGSYKGGSDALTGSDDTATSLWGSNWRMPTRVEMQALISNCNSEWTTVNDVAGRRYTGKGDYASNSIFLPAAGYYYNSFDKVFAKNDNGYYWASTANDNTIVFDLNFYPSNEVVYADNRRYYGMSVRAVLAE